jgi:hypothetical protein
MKYYASSKSVEWYTPKYIFQALNTKFDLDVASPNTNIYKTPTAKHYTIEDDGLKQPWFGNVWCNPPYGAKTDIWYDKMAEHNQGIALFTIGVLPTRKYHKIAHTIDAVLFTNHKIKFVNGDNLKSSCSPLGSMLLAWGQHNVKALEQSKLGVVYYNHK